MKRARTRRPQPTNDLAHELAQAVAAHLPLVDNAKHQAFLADGVAALAECKASGLAYREADVHAYLDARLKGEIPAPLTAVPFATER